MHRTQPPFRCDHVGSLLRPADLMQARAEHARGEIDADALRAVEDKAIADVVRKQENVGLPCVTDGEFRRAYFHLDFLRALLPARRRGVVCRPGLHGAFRLRVPVLRGNAGRRQEEGAQGEGVIRRVPVLDTQLSASDISGT